MKNKNYYKLTLQFNDSDVHEEALSTLKQLDRKKSEFIAQCVVFYMNNSEDDVERIKKLLVGNNFNLSEQSFENLDEFVKNSTPKQKPNDKNNIANKIKPKSNDQKEYNVDITNSKFEEETNKEKQEINQKRDVEKPVKEVKTNLDKAPQDKTNTSIENTIEGIDDEDLLDALDIFNNF